MTGGERDGNFFSAHRADRHQARTTTPTARSSSGPVASVYRVGSEDEAIELANDTPFGLGSYVLTTDADQALRVADRIEAGMVFVNAVGAESAELPFGGVKRSGLRPRARPLRRRRVRQQEADQRRRLKRDGRAQALQTPARGATTL